jgi:peroxiredoxin
MGRFIIFTFLLLGILSGYGQSKIKIHFPGAENLNAHIWDYSDYISLSKREIGNHQFDKNGNIDFKVYVGNAKPIFIQVQYIRIQLFVEPNRNYDIQIDKVDFTNPELYPKNVIGYLSPNFKINKPAKHELNKGLDSVKILFSTFVDSNYLSLVRGLNTRSLVDSFGGKVDQFTKSFGNPYLNNYANFQMTELRLLSREYSSKMVVDKEFVGNNLNLDNPYAMNFFNSFWSNYLTMKGVGFSPFQLDSVINKEQSYQALSALMARDPLLKDSSLRELVIIRNIPQMYANRRFNKKALINILYDISASKLRKQHQIIATNVRKKLESFQVGSPAPDFEFTDIRGNKFKLSDFEGKYVYLNIWDTDCPDCLAEMEYAKDLYEDFDDIIAFVSISVDADSSTMRRYVEQREFGWSIAHLNDNFKFLSDYHVSVLPRYILINKEGKLEMPNAALPSQHFSELFLKMLNDKKGNLELRNK